MANAVIVFISWALFFSLIDSRRNVSLLSKSSKAYYLPFLLPLYTLPPGEKTQHGVRKVSDWRQLWGSGTRTLTLELALPSHLIPAKSRESPRFWALELAASLSPSWV